MPESTPEEVLAMVESEGCEFVDFRFIDLPGVMQHVTIPASVLDEGQFTDGHGFDGSSVRGFQEIQESDMVLIADPDTAYIDPFMKRKTAVIHCYVADPVTGESYSRDPRYVATKAMRESYAPIITACEALGKNAEEHITNYGPGVERRLTGLHETAPWTEFSYGVSNRGASVRIPWQVEVEQKGYLEDRRPNSNCDPYTVTRLIVETCCGALAEGE